MSAQRQQYWRDFLSSAEIVVYIGGDRAGSKANYDALRSAGGPEPEQPWWCPRRRSRNWSISCCPACGPSSPPPARQARPPRRLHRLRQPRTPARARTRRPVSRSPGPAAPR
ncbi:hypothetical protein ACU4GD_31295 [Cupriavidus basilensis]